MSGYRVIKSKLLLLVSSPKSVAKRSTLLSSDKFRHPRNMLSGLSHRQALTAVLIAASVAGIAYFGSSLYALSSASRPLDVASTSQSANATTSIAKPMNAARPSQLLIPRIGLETAVSVTSLDANGAIAVPDSTEVSAWYDKSPTPGEIGPSIIVGHVRSVSGPAVFWDLRELRSGDRIKVIREDNSTATFKVDSVEQFSKENFPSGRVYGNTTRPSLRLITCGGSFSYDQNSFRDNIVVFATLE